MPSFPDPDAVVTVYSVMEPTRAEFLRAKLEEAGIDCEVGGESQGGFTGVTRIDLLVHEADRERAHAIIAEHESGHG
jgi:hypothetical protein